MNDVTERDAFIGAAARGEVPGLRSSPVLGPPRPGGSAGRTRCTAPQSSVRPERPRPRRLRHRRNGGRACFLQVRRCRSPFRDRLRSFMSYVFSALGQENRRATSITCEGRQSSATTARSQPTCTLRRLGATASAQHTGRPPLQSEGVGSARGRQFAELRERTAQAVGWPLVSDRSGLRAAALASRSRSSL